MRAQLALRDGELAAREAELVAARTLNRRTEESVTWQAFQRVRGRLYGAIGETSLLARTLRVFAEACGQGPDQKAKVASVKPDGQGEARQMTTSGPCRMISLPEYENPKVSLIIPLYARADLTRACLESIRDNTTRVSYEVILVEDDADEDTKRLLGAGARSEDRPQRAEPWAISAA